MAGKNQNTENGMETQLNTMDIPLIIPASKLDADQYSADDLDGVTESLFGSGSMAYGVLQASQTDAALLADSAFAYDESEISEVGASGAQPHESASVTDMQDNAALKNNGATDTDRNIDNQNNVNQPNTDSSDGNFSAGTVGSIGASQHSSDAGAFSADESDSSLASGLDGRTGVDGETPDIPDIPPPADGRDGTDGNGNIIVNIDLGDVDLGDVVEIIDGLIIDLGDTITTLSTEITNITDILGDVITNLDALNIENITSLITNITNSLTQTLNYTLTEITNITNNVTNILDEILGGSDGLNLNLDLNALDTLMAGVNVPLDNLLDTDTELNVDLNPVHTLANNIADLTGLDILSDTLGEFGATVETLQNTINQVTDLVSDLNLNDPGATIEQLIGTLENLDDIASGMTNSVDGAVGGVLDNFGIGDGEGPLNGDEVQDVTQNLTDALDGAVEGVTDMADNLAIDLADTLLDIGDGNQGGSGDTDITADLGAEQLNLGIIDEPIEATIDPVEDLAGDIDLNLNLDSQLLGSNEGSGETDNNAGDTDITLNTGVDLNDTTLTEFTMDIPLDPVEEIAGDIDLDIGAAVDFLDDTADPIVNDGEGGSAEETLLSELGDSLEKIAETILPDAGADNAAPDPVEELTSDLNLDIGDALDLLNGDNLDDSEEETSSIGETSWTESTIGEGGLFDDLAGILGDPGDTLPDPSGTVAEGLGALDIGSDADTGSLGGLFG